MSSPMSSQDIRVPDIGDFSDVEIIEVHVGPGDPVNAEDPLITLESDKAAMDVPAPFSGTIEAMTVKIGDRVSEGDVIAQMQATDAAAPAETKAESDTAPEPESKPELEKAAPPPPQPAVAGNTPPVTLPPPVERSGVVNPHASPSIRRFARELGVDLSQVRGSGPKGRILKEDVQGFVKGRLSQPAPAAGGGVALPEIPKVDFAKFGPVESKPLSRIKKIAGKHLHACWLNVPHVTQHEDADITEMEAFRQAHKNEAKAQGFNLTPLVFAMKAAVGALRQYPQFNASLDATGENLVLKRYYNIGVAVDTPGGLVVPVIRGVDQKGFFQLAQELAETSKKARDGKLSPNDLQGGSFSISSLGGIGGTAFSPIVNAPEVAILGLSKSEIKPVWNGGEFEPRLMLPLSLSYDHRIIDGAEGARFIVCLAGMLSDIRRLML